MLSHVCGEHFDNLGMVYVGVASDALKGVDTTETYVELRAAELIDGSRKSLRDLAGSIQPVREAREDGANDGN